MKQPFVLKRKVFPSLVIASIVALGLLCLDYGTFFAPGLRRRSSGDFTGDPVFHTFTDDSVHRSVLLPPDLVVKSFPVCDLRLSELIPCLDRNLLYQLKLKLNLSLMEHYERHCPPPARRYNCLIPSPIGYRIPIRWPASRDEVWKVNIPHTHLASEKSDQRWMVVNGNKINFPGGGTHFHAGADKYIVHIAQVRQKTRSDCSNSSFFIHNLVLDAYFSGVLLDAKVSKKIGSTMGETLGLFLTWVVVSRALGPIFFLLI